MPQKKPLSTDTLISVFPRNGGWEYNVTIYGHNYGGGWSPTSDSLADTIGYMLRFDLKWEQTAAEQNADRCRSNSRER